jgi:hypothetical protein
MNKELTTNSNQDVLGFTGRPACPLQHLQCQKSHKISIFAEKWKSTYFSNHEINKVSADAYVQVETSTIADIMYYSF